MATEAPPGSRLLDRDAPLAALLALARRAADGLGATAVVEGDPGIGKTALLDALAASLDVPVLRAAGGELEGGAPFGVVRQLLGDVVAPASLDGAAALAAPVFAGQAPVPTELAAALHGLHWVIAGLCDTGPLVLIVDDVQWADGPSRRFLAYLARRLDDLPCLLVAARRTGAATVADPEQEALIGAAATRLHLGPLGTTAVHELLVRELGPAVEPGFAHACREATGGNAFLVVALARELARQGVRGRDDEVEAIEAAGGADVAAALQRRLAGHGSAAEKLAQAVAVLGPAATFRRAGALAGLEPDACAPVVDVLVAERLLADTRPLTFVHPLLRTAAYEAMDAAQRADRHARAAALLAADGDREEAAQHLLMAGPAGDPLAIAVLRHAADRALARAAPETAIAYLERALQEPAAPRDQVDILVALSTAWFLHGGAGLAVTHLDRALALAPDGPDRSRVLAYLARAVQWTGDMERAVEIAREVAEPLTETAHGREARLVMTVAGSGHVGARARIPDVVAFLHGELAGEDAATAAAAAIELAMTLGPAQAIRGLVRRAIDDDELWTLDPVAAVQGLLGTAATVAEDRDLALTIYDRGVVDGQARGSGPVYVGAVVLRAWAQLRFGRLAEAEADARGVLGLAGSQAINELLHPVAVGTLVATQLARHGAATARQLHDELGVEPDPARTPDQQLVIVLADLALAEGRPEAALEVLERLRVYEAAFGSPAPSTLPWRAIASAALLAVRDRDAAIAEARLFHEHALVFDAPGVIGRALHARGRAEEDLALLDAAVGHLERSPLRLAHAQALADLGVLLRDAGGADGAAREALRNALDLAVASGARPLADRVAADLRAAGGRPRRLRSTGADALTPAELRTARLAISGLTNREIAQASFLSPRTVEMHLSNAYRKLGITGREALADALP